MDINEVPCVQINTDALNKYANFVNNTLSRCRCFFALFLEMLSPKINCKRISQNPYISGLYIVPVLSREHCYLDFTTLWQIKLKWLYNNVKFTE